MKNLKLISAALFITFGSMGAAYAAPLHKDDAKFIEKAAQAGHFEIKASELASKQSTNAEVQTFATQMVADHTKVGNELDALAQTKGVTTPKEPSKDQQKELTKLGTLTGHAFDKEYADEVATDAHEDAVKLFKKASKDAKDADIKAFATKNLPALQQHLDMGKTLEKAVKQVKS